VRKRSSHNTNLTLHHSGPWRGYDVQLQRGPLIISYLERIHQTMQRAIEHQPRTMAVRLDLSLPANGYFRPGDPIDRFIKSLRAQIDADMARRKRDGRTSPDCRLKYVCVREQDDSYQPHFHFGLFLNGDCYRSLGEMPTGNGAGAFNPDVPADPNAVVADSLAKRIVTAWARALGWSVEQTVGLVHFSEGGTYWINPGSPICDSQVAGLFNRLSYLAKESTKQFGHGGKNFRYSLT
jgi:protein GP2